MIKRHFLGTVGETLFCSVFICPHSQRYVAIQLFMWPFNCSCGLPDAIDIKYGYFLWNFFFFL
jgi:hypothetical protein